MCRKALGTINPKVRNTGQNGTGKTNAFKCPYLSKLVPVCNTMPSPRCFCFRQVLAQHCFHHSGLEEVFGRHMHFVLTRSCSVAQELLRGNTLSIAL